ncbi:peptidyl-tRNA hydrolase [Desulfocurvibacter africanus PCS]|uniref:Peptidyl-tRNA hydrolase n=1 Tax=Desulfocurvibacter africanus PCS TaxID=1262666 RepID=M5PX72_DESAF|nr:aminoacyl-tRNA hydrolase [Desulfocurvibacter africanus]EMG38570.1 peptidyl-tRNA hydrolase [Desulfocurvibacter africanus PCS]
MDLKGLIVGLGNPGPEYEQTRHNIGFMLVDAVLEEIAAKPYRRMEQLPATDLYRLWRISLPRVKGDFLLAKPLTYMNLSGIAVARICRENGIQPRNALIAHDEIDLPLGRMKFKVGGGAAGHNGVTSIVNELGTSDFPRLRLGIGKPTGALVREHVLTDFTSAELTLVNLVLAAARDALPVYFGKGLTAAMQAVNSFNAVQQSPSQG